MNIKGILSFTELLCFILFCYNINILSCIKIKLMNGGNVKRHEEKSIGTDYGSDFDPTADGV